MLFCFISEALGCFRENKAWNFPGGPVVKFLHFHCREPGFRPWSVNYEPACSCMLSHSIMSDFLLPHGL